MDRSVYHLDLGEVDAEGAVDAGALDADEDAQIDRRPRATVVHRRRALKASRILARLAHDLLDRRQDQRHVRLARAAAGLRSTMPRRASRNSLRLVKL